MLVRSSRRCLRWPSLLLPTESTRETTLPRRSLAMLSRAGGDVRPAWSRAVLSRLWVELLRTCSGELRPDRVCHVFARSRPDPWCELRGTSGEKSRMVVMIDIYLPRADTVRCSLIAPQSLSKRCSPRLPSPGAVCLTACLEQFVDVLRYQASIVKIIMPSSRVTHKYAKQGEEGLRVVRNGARSRGPERCSAVTESPFALSCPR